MFASMFKSLLNKSVLDAKKETIATAVKDDTVIITRKDVEDMLTELDEIKDNTDNDDNYSVTKDNVTDAIESLSIADYYPEYLNDSASVDNFDDSKSEVSSIGENQLSVTTVEDPNIKKTLNQINSLQCLFTWNIKSKNKKDLILYIRNKYGEYNLNITSSEFTLERFIGNIIIGYELFHNGETELAQMKILEIGTWLEDLDKGVDEFYLSIKTGVQHVMKATFIHMLFATNLTGECKWDDIESFANMDSKSRASVHAIRSAVLIEYGGNPIYLKKACEVAKKACDLDPKTSHWFYIHSLALTAQRKFSQSHKSSPTENEMNTIHQAIILSNGKNALFNYHNMVLYKDTTAGNFHNNKNKNDKSLFKKNVQDNKKIVHMIKTIIDMDPKDPHLVVKCARTLMTLPIMVRDFNLGKQYLTKAFEMAPNDATVLQAIENTVQAYKDSKKQKPKTNETKQNQLPAKNKTSKLGMDIGFIVKKQKNGEDPVPFLTNLLSKYDGLDKSKIMAQLCSYAILFENNLRSGVEQFIKLIEQSEIVSNDIITKHVSSFGSKSFSLPELICNEIRLITNLSGTSSDDMLYYFKMLTKIIETCNLKLEEVDSSMKSKLIIDSSVKSVKSTSVRSETESSDNVTVDKIKPKIKPKKNHKAKHLQNTGPKVFTQTVKLNNGAKAINANSKNNKNASEKVQNKKPQPKVNDVSKMKVKMEKVLNSANGEGVGISNKSKNLPMDSQLGMPQGIRHYTQQLYQNILANTQSRFNSLNVSSTDLNNYFNQNHANFRSPMQSNPFQNPYTPPLLSLKPEISPKNPKPKPKTNFVQSHSKKK